ncbi:hypothetical protein AMAG_11821 [Allomyces macrogynus ATCC 38327]|uniref:Uncharacterized protein n=1 Tax=Allomyces macrogynus (strain ATCC 38327) TaxID=578462 RepID=A0A0L0SXR3_ALLM3|nr:hypothetical protein AMAG_11821 [Allomyces macrogynus ATCC 38327]|eukprot:KNE67353.1 hypothetical protein AMAG_11821 [Allomyces macrogynus ATCC 38327]
MSTIPTTAAVAPATATTEPTTTTPSPVPGPTSTTFPDLPTYTAHPVYASLIARIRRAEKFGSPVSDDDRHLYRAFKFGTPTDAKPEPVAAKAATPAKGSKGKATPSSRRGGRRSRVSSTSAAAKLASGILDQGKTAVDTVKSGRVGKRSAASVKSTAAAASSKAATSKPTTPASLISESDRRMQSADMTALEAWYKSKNGGENGTSSA